MKWVRKGVKGFKNVACSPLEGPCVVHSASAHDWTSSPPTMPWQKWWAAFVIPEFSSLRFQDHKSEVMQEAILQIKMKTMKSHC